MEDKQRETLNEGRLYIHGNSIPSHGNSNNVLFWNWYITISKHRNLQKRARKTRHEREKCLWSSFVVLGIPLGSMLVGGKQIWSKRKLRTTLHVINTELN